MSINSRFVHGGWPASLALGLCCFFQAKAGSLQLVSQPNPSSIPPAGGSGDSYLPVISPDGRYVLFASTANNLAVNSNENTTSISLPPKLNVFLRDRTSQTTTLVSMNLLGTGSANSNSLPAGISTNGRYALFESIASNLVTNDANKTSDIYLRDLLLGTNLLVSVATNGASGNGASRSAAMTPDGRLVVFVSSANNLVPGDNNRLPDVFLRDTQSGTTTLISVGATPTRTFGSGNSSESPDITPDGRFVVFSSTATNLVSGVAAAGGIYVRDLANGTTAWASDSAQGALHTYRGISNAVCFNQAISANGEFVAYQTAPVAPSSLVTAGLILRYNRLTGSSDVVYTNAWVPPGPVEQIHNLDISADGRFVAFIGNTNDGLGPRTCVYVWDSAEAATKLASGDLSNNVPLHSSCDSPTMDASGRFIAFVSDAANLVTNSLTGGYHLYVRDMESGVIKLVDANTNDNRCGVSPSLVPQLTADGLLIFFEHGDGTLVPDDRNHGVDIFAQDLSTRANELISRRDPGLPCSSANGSSRLFPFSVNADGRYITFASDADNLVPGETNGWRDIFSRDLLFETNILISVGTNGAPANGFSTDPSINEDGRFIAFASVADNLVPGDINKTWDVFVRDRVGSTTRLVSISTNGVNSGDRQSFSPSISPNGRFVLFYSQAQNLAPGTVMVDKYQLFVRDLELSTNYLLSRADALPAPSAMDRNGRYVAFSGLSTTLTKRLYLWDSQSATLVYTNPVFDAVALAVSSDGNRLVYVTNSQNSPTIRLVDRAANTDERISFYPTAATNTSPRFSSDGRFVAYLAKTYVTNQVFLYDCELKTNLLVSQGINTSPANAGRAFEPDISADGRFVAYRSVNPNIVPTDNNALADVFLFDRIFNSTILLSANRFGTSANGSSSLPRFSGDGSCVVFQSRASDFTARDFNQAGDLFAYKVFSSSPISPFPISIIRPATGSPWVVWPVIPGKSYRVQFKNALDDPDWQELPVSVEIVGNQGYLNDLSAGTGDRFYRVVAF